MEYNVRVAYSCRNGNVRSLNINWEDKTYVKNRWDAGWGAYVEAKLAKDIDDLESELIRSGFTERRAV